MASPISFRWDTLSLYVDLLDADDARVLKIGISPEALVSKHSIEAAPYVARLSTAAMIALELDVGNARAVRDGLTVDLDIRPPRPFAARTITSAEDAAVMRPLIEELIAPLLYGPLPHPPLRSFQDVGIQWLVQRGAAILADDMGLGKTAQALLALQVLLLDGVIRSALIICPKSLVANWESECRKWVPALTVLRAVPRRHDVEQTWLAILGRSHLVIASYEQLRPLPAALRDSQIELVVADEAHRLRRSQAQLVRTFRHMHASRFWALTGTPIERHPLDLATILSLLEPSRFSARSAVIESELRSSARPYILRRLKKDVLAELPKVLETKEAIELSSAQRQAYSAVQSRPLDRTSNDVLHRLSLLRSICDVDSESDASSKIDRIVEILLAVQKSGERAIVFSYLLRPLQLLYKRLLQHDPPITALLLTGENSADNRTEILQQFRSDAGIVVLLCSSRVGGEGLTLTEANHVIFLNEWWNPSANAQARDRVVRLGQERIVHVHRFRCRNTVEYLLDSILEEKERTFASIVDALVKEVRLDGVDVSALLNDALENVDASFEE